MRYHSRSITGQASRANNDYAGATCEGDGGFFVVADGTSRRGSGQLAESFVSGMLAAHSTRMEQGAILQSPQQLSVYWVQYWRIFMRRCLLIRREPSVT